MIPGLGLDYQQKPRPRWVGWALLGMALMLAADVAVRQQEAESQIAVWQSSAQRTGVAGAAPRDAQARDAADEGLMREAGSVVGQLTLPWLPLFAAIEQAHMEAVALLAVQPDGQRRSVTIIGEAKSYDDVLVYVTRLRDPAGLKSVHLVGNEVREDQPQRPIAFTVSADWKGLQ